MTVFAHKHKLFSSRLNFTEHADGWIAQLQIELSKTYPNVSICSSSRSSDFGGTFIDLGTIDSGREFNSGLGLLVEQDDTRSQFYAVDDDPIDGGLLKSLSKAVQRAVQLVVAVAADFEWSALLVQTPRMLSYPCRLEGTLHIGSMTLRATDTDFTDLVYHHDSGNSMSSGYKMQVSRPIWVVGRTNASSMESAVSKAGRELRRVCGLLAVAWGVPYEIAVAPMPQYDQGPPQHKVRPGICLVQEASPVEKWEAHPVPRWTDDAYHQAEGEELTAALDMFLEAEYVSARHPSVSAVAYVAAIEAIGNTLFTSEVCTCCNSLPGATKRYRETVRLVVSDSVAQRLNRVYGWRSTTVHQGSLHSTEVNWSRGWARMLDPRDSENMAAVIPELREATRLLIERGLNNQLPEPRPLHIAAQLED
ncbi:MULTISPECIES: hypothetical protein [unclassified Brevibacterium]|uniref:hypothetical protein n=1 Tax=unclassified Brevibacterium TaxID=2614124 RepID=UPI001091C7D8|nr:hypothetical protein [Brevibacterium sp. S22]TGD30872.1 hypothetical protein EB835_10850 [Brevibacterium sp. S22]